MPGPSSIQRFRKFVRPIASLRLTVPVLFLSMLLIFFGTLAQTTRGIWWVMDVYFTSWGVMVPMDIFAPPGRKIPGAFPFPGGATLALVLLINLIAAHSLRFRVRLKGLQLVVALGLLIISAGLIALFHNAPLASTVKASGGLAAMLLLGAVMYTPTILVTAWLFGRKVGIVLIHGSLILLIVGEGVTRTQAVETNMPIHEGESINWVQDMRTVEFAVVDKSDPEVDRVTVISQNRLRKAEESGQLISDSRLPFEIRVERYAENSSLEPRSPNESAAGFVGTGRTWRLSTEKAVSGVGDEMYNMPGVQVTLLRGQESLGTYVFSTVSFFSGFMGEPWRAKPQRVAVDGNEFSVDLRFERHYKPYSLKLNEFHHDLYPGTQVPLNFASDITLVDPEAGVERDVTIRMNEPLRYAGETFFQAGFMEGNGGTILQVVNNPGWTMPYIACTLGGAGLLIHFVMSLTRFRRRELA